MIETALKDTKLIPDSPPPPRAGKKSIYTPEAGQEIAAAAISEKREKEFNDHIIRWYILRTDSPHRLKERLSAFLAPPPPESVRLFEKLCRQRGEDDGTSGALCPAFSEIYLPVVVQKKWLDEPPRNAEEDRQRYVRSNQLLLAHYLFVRTSMKQLRTYSTYIAPLRLEQSADRIAGRPMVVDDNVMEIFRAGCEKKYDLEFLQNAFGKYTGKDYAEILSGPAKGCKGFIGVSRKSVCLT